MNIKGMLEFLDQVTDAAKKFAPIATELGIPFVEKVAGLADTAVDIAQNALERAEDAKVVLTSQDKIDIEKRITTLNSINDDLARFIKLT